MANEHSITGDISATEDKDMQEDAMQPLLDDIPVGPKETSENTLQSLLVDEHLVNDLQEDNNRPVVAAGGNNLSKNTAQVRAVQHLSEASRHGMSDSKIRDDRRVPRKQKNSRPLPFGEDRSQSADTYQDATAPVLFPDMTSLGDSTSVDNIYPQVNINETPEAIGNLDRDEYGDGPHRYEWPIMHHNIPNSALIQTYRLYWARWYVLLLFSAVNMLQSEMCGVYSAVADASEAVFGWTDEEISLMQNWFYVTFLLGVLPFMWLQDKKGLRTAMLLTCGLVFFGSCLRLFHGNAKAVTGMINISNFLIGLGGPITFSAGPTISQLWFPPDERATATAIGTISGFTGSALTFVAGASYVQAPKYDPISKNITNIQAMKQNIYSLRTWETCLFGGLFFLVISYFPDKPKHPPCLTASLKKIPFWASIRIFFSGESMQFWLVCLPYAISTGVYGLWQSLLTVILRDVLTEEETGYIGGVSILVGALASVVVSRIVDRFKLKMKSICVFLLGVCCLSTFWVLLVAIYLPSRAANFTALKVQLYMGLIAQSVSNMASIPLFFEMAIEGYYPIPETAITGSMNVMYNALPLLILALFWIPNIGLIWLSWFLYLSLFFCTILMLLFVERRRRTAVDNLADSLSGDTINA